MIDQIRIRSPLVDKDLCEAKMKDIYTRLDGMDVALVLKTDELKHHLDDLNHAHKTNLEERIIFVKNEKFDAKIEMINLAISEHKESINKVKTASVVWIIGIGIVLGVLDFIWRVLVK